MGVGVGIGEFDTGFGSHAAVFFIGFSTGVAFDGILVDLFVFYRFGSIDGQIACGSQLQFLCRKQCRADHIDVFVGNNGQVGIGNQGGTGYFFNAAVAAGFRGRDIENRTFTRALCRGVGAGGVFNIDIACFGADECTGLAFDGTAVNVDAVFCTQNYV